MSQNTDYENNNININNKISWLEKYRPECLSDYYISKKQLDIVKIWIKDFRNNNLESRPFLILYGSTGIGKTTLAYLILKYYDYEIIECNASDTRTKKNIRESLGQISKVSVCVDIQNRFKKVAIIMDEIDGLAGGESNSVQEIIDIVTKDKDSNTLKYICPVICTTNSIKDKKLIPLIKQGVVLNICKPSNSDCIKLINKISSAECFIVPINIINDIVVKAYGDYRQIIMLLFSYYHSIKIEFHNAQISLKNNLTENKKVIANDTKNDTENDTENDTKNDTEILQVQEHIYTYYEDNDHFDIIKKISNSCETPIDKINFFLTNNTHVEDICYMCSSDSNLYYMNFYINVITIISEIQNNYGLIKTKKNLLNFFIILSKIYNLLKEADLLNNSIFIDKKWELLEYFDEIGVALPINIINNFIINNVLTNNIIRDYKLIHHTQYNFMRQEQSIIKKKLHIDYIITYDNDITNIYYNIKKFKIKYKTEILESELRSKKKKKTSSIEESKYIIDRTYKKIIDKIDELLS